MDGKRITFNNIEESEKNIKKNKINQHLNGIISPYVINNALTNKHQNNKDLLYRSFSPSDSISVANNSPINKRNTKSIVKKEINRVTKVVEDFSSTKFLNEFINEKHPKDKNSNPIFNKKSAEKNKEYNNSNIHEINNKYNIEQNLNLKSKQKIVNGRNIAMMRQKSTNDNIVKINKNKNVNNKNSNTNTNTNYNNMKIKNHEYNSNAKSRSKSKTPKREREIIFDNKSESEKNNGFENFENKKSWNKTNNEMRSSNNTNNSSNNNNNNIFMYSNMNNKVIPNNCNSVEKLSNLNSSYENPILNNKNLSSNSMISNEYQGFQFQNISYNPAFINKNMSNIFSNNNSVNMANLENNNFNFNQ